MHRALELTFGWPYVRFSFHRNDELVAIATFSFTGKEWFCLPHSDSLGLWIKDQYINILDGSGTKTDSLDLNYLNRIIYAYLSGKIDKKSSEINIDLSEHCDYLKPSEQGYRNKLPVRLRSVTPLFNYNSSFKVLSILLLEKSKELQFGNFSSNIRRKIHKAERNEISVVSGGVELINDFYSQYRKNIHKHTSMGLPQPFFKNLILYTESYKCILFVAYKSGIPVGSASLIIHKEIAENNTFSTLKSHNNLYVSYALHSAMLDKAIKSDCQVYSFGRSNPQNSIHHYKKQYNTTDLNLYNSCTIDNKPANKMKVMEQFIRITPLAVLKSFDKIASRLFY